MLPTLLMLEEGARVWDTTQVLWRVGLARASGAASGPSARVLT